MDGDLETRLKLLAHQIDVAKTAEEVRLLVNSALGSKGWVTDALTAIKTVPPGERKAYGQAVNEVKAKVKEIGDAKTAELQKAATSADEYLDITLPGADVLMGRLHPVTLVYRRICEIFIGMGFQVVEGPEIEDEYHNFEALNIPANHPARDDMDTFYLGAGILLRTHTSPVQIRTMEAIEDKDDVLIRIISPGNAYRRDKPDRTHTSMFSQVEGLMIGKDVTFAHMNGILAQFARSLFGPTVKTRLRPDFFPFVEPGAEVAISCPLCGGEGCPTCKKSGWIEILGAGMVHPNVLRAVNIDPERFQGFAFGMGIERVAMIYYRIDDMRLFFENDVEFLKRFG